MTNKSADPYMIKKENEWKEILGNHNCLYYPRNQNDDAETTYYKICEYFSDKAEKPSFLKNRSFRTMKLERLLASKRKTLEAVEGLTKYEKAQILMDIKMIEAKLKIRRK